jgi:hypothetical protein
MNKVNWTFSDYLNQIFMLSEIAEIPGVEADRSALIDEMWARYPTECKAIGLTDHA